LLNESDNPGLPDIPVQSELEKIGFEKLIKMHGSSDV